MNKQGKKYVASSIKLLSDNRNILIWFFPYNGIIINDCREELGEVSQKVIEKLVGLNVLIYCGYGSGIFFNERYYKMKSQ